MAHAKEVNKKMVFSNELFDRFRREKLIWISPEAVKYCTPASSATDLNQHEADRDHPHAYYNRGYFLEINRRGSLLAGDWDVPDLQFDALLEYNAINDHILGYNRWSHSEFAKRLVRYISLGNAVHGYTEPQKYIIERERRLDHLVERIASEGVIPVKGHSADKADQDDISVNFARDGKVLFNNRGHHRLSIAKVLRLPTIPVQCVICHAEFFDYIHRFTPNNSSARRS